jgi:hypothetical protein
MRAMDRRWCRPWHLLSFPGTKRSRCKAPILALLLFVCPGCGSDRPVPAAPTPTPAPETSVPDLPIEDGPYVVGLTGFAVSEDPFFPTCSPVGVPREGTAVTARVRVAREDREWVVRSDPPAPGDLEVRVHAVPSPPGMYVVSGTARGCVRDEAFGPHERTDVQLCIDGADGKSPARLDGRLSYDGRVLTAVLTGAFAFSDRTGQTGRCAAIEMFLRTRGSF